MGGWLWALFFAVAICFGAIFSATQHQLAADNIAGNASATAGNMMVYRNAVADYARANPGVKGAVTDQVLNLPLWYTRLTGVTNYVSGGTGFVYFANPSPEVVYQLVSITQNSVLVGVNQNGAVFNPVRGVSMISLPANSPIPEGAAVIVGAS